MNVRVIETGFYRGHVYKIVFGKDNDVLFWVDSDGEPDANNHLCEKYYCTSPFDSLERKFERSYLDKIKYDTSEEAIKAGLKILSVWTTRISKSSQQKLKQKKIRKEKEPYCPSAFSMYGA